VIIGVLIFLAALIISLMRGTPRVTSFSWLKKQIVEGINVGFILYMCISISRLLHSNYCAKKSDPD